MICRHCNGSFEPKGSNRFPTGTRRSCPGCGAATGPRSDGWIGPVIEAVALPRSRDGQPRTRAAAASRRIGTGTTVPSGRLTRSLPTAVAAALLLVLGIGATAFHRPIGAAVAEVAGLTPKFDGFAFRGVRSETRPTREGTALMVEGELVNMTGAIAPVPAIRLSLHDGRTEVYGWSVELTRASLAPGEAIAFRSFVPVRAGRAENVVASLAERQGEIIGLR